MMCGQWLAAMIEKLEIFWSQSAKLTKMLIFLSINSAIANFWCELKSLHTKFLHYKSWDLPKTPLSGQIKWARWTIRKWKLHSDWLYPRKGMHIGLKQPGGGRELDGPKPEQLQRRLFKRLNKLTTIFTSFQRQPSIS